MAKLNTLYNTGSNQVQLPNAGGTYQAPTITSPFPNAHSTIPSAYGSTTPIFASGSSSPSGGGGGGSWGAPSTVTSPTGAQSAGIPPATRSKYINPKTGTYFTSPEEYGNYIATKIPVAYDVPRTAGDALTNPDQSAAELTTTARNLNNARNDIAVGETDPYKVGNKSGVAYSPAELNAIEKAYAGIYDPALNDVFTRLKAKQDEDKAAEKAKQDREDRIFATNEAIRQWKSTTGTKGGGGSDSDLFTQTQLNNGARNAGMTIEAFGVLDNDLKNFFVQPPSEIDEVTGKSFPMNKTFDNLIKLVLSGDTSAKDAADEIESSNLTESVKHYYLDQLPLQEEEKKGYFSRLWSAIKGE